MSQSSFKGPECETAPSKDCTICREGLREGSGLTSSEVVIKKEAQIGFPVPEDCQYNTMPTLMRPGMQRFSSGESGGRRRKTDSEYSPHVGMQTAAHFLNRLMPPSVEFSLLGVELLPRIQPFRVKVEIVHLPHRLRDFKPGG